MHHDQATMCCNGRVILVKMDGSELPGSIVDFMPATPRVLLNREKHDEGEEALVAIAPDEIAYIAFYPQPEAEPGKWFMQTLSHMISVVIHTQTSRSIPVYMIDYQSRRGGFYAFNANRNLPYEYFFFYRHGVRSVQQIKRLGELLIDEGEANNVQVLRALSERTALHNKTLGEILIGLKRVEPIDVEKALGVQQRRKIKIGAALLEAGMINQEDLELALAEQEKNRRIKFGEMMIRLGFTTEEKLTAVLAKKFHLPFIDLDNYPIDENAVGEIDEQTLQTHQILPIKCDETTITVAFSDPLDTLAFDSIRLRTRKRLEVVLAAPSQLHKHLTRLLGTLSTEERDWLWVEDIVKPEGGEHENEVVEMRAAGAPPIVRLVNRIILGAFTAGASDIHLLPQQRNLLILYRIHGDLVEAQQLEKWVQQRVISRIKLLCGMNIADHRITQDGRMTVQHENRRIELRVSCIPSGFGESLVMRILNKEGATGLGSIGLSERDEQLLAQMTRRSYGLILATGPTGSGKSTTLFSILQSVQSRPVHIITIEDPIESPLPGVNQIQVNNKVGLTFARILRNVLRHDPDVVMIGEIRDQETAMIGIEAALTGHLMLSTLHTNSAVDTVLRLQDLGVPNYLLSPALLGVISQNLLRRLCPECRQPVDPASESYRILLASGHTPPKPLYARRGCSQCRMSGYIGRVMVYEFLAISDAIRQAIHRGEAGYAIQQLAITEGMTTKSEHALQLAAAGVIDCDDLVKTLI